MRKIKILYYTPIAIAILVLYYCLKTPVIFGHPSYYFEAVVYGIILAVEKFMYPKVFKKLTDKEIEEIMKEYNCK